MKWETLKDTVAREVRFSVVQGKTAVRGLILTDLVVTDFEAARGRTNSEICTACGDKAWDIIQSWDIRAVGRLRDLFPECFPPSLRKGVLQCDFTDDGWTVISRT